MAALLWSALSSSPVTIDAQPTPGPPMPYEDVGACPFEGCVYREWIARETVSARTERRIEAPVAFTIQKGERVVAVTGIVVTLRPGRVQFRHPADLSTSVGPLHVEPAQTLYLLTYQGEGATAGWFNGRLFDWIDGSEFFNGLCQDRPGTCNGTILEQPRAVWWVRLKTLRGLTGWTNQPDRFDNKDAYGQ